MFLTVIRDVFTRDEAVAVRQAIEYLCSPLDSTGWASVGVYAFFDPTPDGPPVDHAVSRLLYAGLARDLPERFAQHTGLMSFPAGGCKREQIEVWFEGHESLGVSLALQSPAAQVDTHRERGRLPTEYDEQDPAGFASNPTEGLEAVVSLEGQVLEAHRRIHRALPPWNRIGGSRQGAARVGNGPFRRMLEVLDGRADWAFLARRSLRELSEQPEAAWFEAVTLHLARSESLLRSATGLVGDEDVYARLHELAADPPYSETTVADDLRRIVETGYLNGAPGWAA